MPQDSRLGSDTGGATRTFHQALLAKRRGPTCSHEREQQHRGAASGDPGNGRSGFAGALLHLLMIAICGGTCLIGTAILTVATHLSRKAVQASREQPAGNRAPTVLSAASPGQVDIADIAFLAQPQGQEAVTKRRRFCQVLLVFLCTFLLSASVALLGLWDGSLSTVRGLAWESYTLLLSAGCTWLLIQALLVAKKLPAGKGYATTAFAEAMVSAVMPFASDAFDTLKDVLFGALCFKSRHLGVQILGGISWLYLLDFHLVLLRKTRLMRHVAPHGHYFRAITRARRDHLTERGHIITDTTADDLAVDVCVRCLMSNYGGDLDLRSRGLGGQKALLNAVATFAVSKVWVTGLDLRDNWPGTRSARPGARALAAKLSACPALKYLGMTSNEVGAEAEEALRKACREHRPEIELWT